MVPAGLDSEGAGEGQDLRTQPRQDDVQLGKAQVVADLESDLAQPWHIDRWHDLLSWSDAVRLAGTLHALLSVGSWGTREHDVEQVQLSVSWQEANRQLFSIRTHLVVISEQLAISSNQHLRVLHTVITLRVLGQVMDAGCDHNTQLLCQLSQAERVLVLRQGLREVARLIGCSSNVIRSFRQEACLQSTLELRSTSSPLHRQRQPRG